MIASIIGLLLAALGLTALALQRFYSSVPAKELKRLAARGDTLATSLYRAVAFGGSLRLFLWIVMSSGLTGGVVLIAQGLPVWASFAVIAAILVIGFVVLQSAKLTVRTAGFAAVVAPMLGAVLGRIEPIAGKITHTVHTHRTFVPHSGLYEKGDLSDLLDQQKNQSDNRITHDELELARRALYFDDTQAADTMTARPDMKTLTATDAIGPILLEELYKSGQRSFVVYDAEGEAGQIVGVVRLQDALNAKQGGKIANIMNKDLAYAHEDFSLRQVVDVCLKTGQPLVLVINAFEELVGVISLESLINELFDVPGKGRLADLPYQDRATVAAYKPPVATADPETDPAEPTLETELDPPEITDQDAKPEASSSEAPEVVK